MVPQPDKMFPWKTAHRRLYEALALEGEVTNHRITSRLRVRYYKQVVEQIREAVRPYGLDVARRPISPGVWTYRLAVSDQSQKVEGT